VSEADPFLVTWGLFRALEAAETLPDPTVDSLLEAAEAEIGTEGLLSGWALLAALLGDQLLRHSQQLGCDCGSLAWLERSQLHHAQRLTETSDRRRARPAGHEGAERRRRLGAVERSTARHDPDRRDEDSDPDDVERQDRR
jgi:hypothetical protein